VCGGAEWRFEASLGQSLSDQLHVGLSDTVTDDVSLRVQAAAALISAHDSTPVSQLKVRVILSKYVSK